MTCKEYKTLRELDVQPGDVVESSARHRVEVADISRVSYCEMTNGFGYDWDMPMWRLISRAPRDDVGTQPVNSATLNGTPTLWRDMTELEQLRLKVAQYEGKVIECWQDSENPGHWAHVSPSWSDGCKYRIRPARPEPKRGAVTLYWAKGCGGCPTEMDGHTHSLTFDLIDGDIPAGTYTSAEGHSITVERNK